MKNVNLFGCTTAEKLIILEEAYNELLELPFVNVNGKGEYSQNAQYNKGDFVSYNGNSYIANQASLGYPPVQENIPIYWNLIAQRGEIGKQGVSGKDGINGVDGKDGVSVVRVENVGTSQGEGFTITHCEATLSNGRTESFDVQALNGKDGQSGASKYINITNVPSTATNGTLTSDDLAVLNESPKDNYIMFYGEKFIPMDIKDSNGYRVYTHHGETDGTRIETSKFIYLTLSTGGWVMNINKEKQYYQLEITIPISGTNYNLYCIFECDEDLDDVDDLNAYLTSHPNYYKTLDVLNKTVIKRTSISTNEGIILYVVDLNFNANKLTIVYGTVEFKNGEPNFTTSGIPSILTVNNTELIPIKSR